MGLIHQQEPRRFNYIPRFHQPESDEKQRIKFRRITLYNPRQSYRKSFLLLALVIFVAAVIYILGGIRPSVNPLELSGDDAVPIFRNEMDSDNALK